ncbi:MAG: UDP-N-acetylmuramate--L-alanine ligase [Acidobacteriota bacterium]
MRERLMHEPCHFYLLPIGGTATAALAGLLHESGERVTGVDSALYPPTSDLLADLGVPVRLGYDPSAIPADLDTVVIGNALPRTNVEVQAVLERGLPYVSQAACLGERFCAPARSVVVAGTHGKTTTSSLVAHLLFAGGFDPTVAVGGQPIGGRPWRLGRGGWTVVEGDEYNTAFFDRGPKFLHYHPHLFVVGNVEFDHGDIYSDLDAILAAFRAGVARVGPDGRVVANLGDGGARAVAEGHPRVLWYGLAEGAELRCTGWGHRGGRLHATLAWRGATFDVDVPLVGRHNLDDVMAASACALEAGMAPADVASALAAFPGVRRRLEVVGEAGGVVVVDDFAHHPTAVRLTLEGARHRFPGRRLVVAFEPRSLTAGRALFFDAYVEAFVKADLALVAPVFHRARLAPEAVLDREALAAAVGARGGNAVALPLDRPVVDVVSEHLRPGDVILCMSSGDFGRLTRTLLVRLAERP